MPRRNNNKDRNRRFDPRHRWRACKSHAPRNTCGTNSRASQRCDPNNGPYHTGKVVTASGSLASDVSRGNTRHPHPHGSHSISATIEPVIGNVVPTHRETQGWGADVAVAMAGRAPRHAKDQLKNGQRIRGNAGLLAPACKTPISWRDGRAKGGQSANGVCKCQRTSWHRCSDPRGGDATVVDVQVDASRHVTPVHVHVRA